MTAQPADDYDPDGPVEILRVLPGRRGTPIEEIVPDWDKRVAAAGRRRAGG